MCIVDISNQIKNKNKIRINYINNNVFIFEKIKIDQSNNNNDFFSVDIKEQRTNSMLFSNQQETSQQETSQQDNSRYALKMTIHNKLSNDYHGQIIFSETIGKVNELILFFIKCMLEFDKIKCKIIKKLNVVTVILLYNDISQCSYKLRKIIV